jgi:hypothetical protein
MTFGEFIVSFYDSCSKPGAGMLVSLALNAGLIRLQLPDHRPRLSILDSDKADIVGTNGRQPR